MVNEEDHLRIQVLRSGLQLQDAAAEINRVDDTLLFHRLSREQMAAIVDIQVRWLQALLEERKIALDLDGAARAWLVEKGYDINMGARPMERIIQEHIKDQIGHSVNNDFHGCRPRHLDIGHNEVHRSCPDI